MIKCSACGKFISYLDFQNKKVKTNYIPPSKYGAKKIEFTHTDCENKTG